MPTWRARATASCRRDAPSLRYIDLICALTVLPEIYSSPAISLASHRGQIAKYLQFTRTEPGRLRVVLNGAFESRPWRRGRFDQVEFDQRHRGQRAGSGRVPDGVTRRHELARRVIGSTPRIHRQRDVPDSILDDWRPVSCELDGHCDSSVRADAGVEDSGVQVTSSRYVGGRARPLPISRLAEPGARRNAADQSVMGGRPQDRAISRGWEGNRLGAGGRCAAGTRTPCPASW